MAKEKAMAEGKDAKQRCLYSVPITIVGTSCYRYSEDGIGFGWKTERAPNVTR